MRPDHSREVRTPGRTRVRGRTSGRGEEEGRALGTVETFDHTADVGLRVTGVDLDALSQTAAGGVFDYIGANRDAVRVAAREPVELDADTPAGLLLAWLNELIFRFETGHTL